MARLPRLEVPGEAHYLILRGHPALGAAGVCGDGEDRATCLTALQEASATEHTHVHAYALLQAELQLLVTPEREHALGRFVQALGRRYVSAYNRRHGRRGTLWEGRFRGAVVESGTLRLQAVLLIDSQSTEPGTTSAAAHAGGVRPALLRDLPEIWQLGNTPFEREAAYRELLASGGDAALAQHLRRAALGGWVAGSSDFAARVASAQERPAAPRPRGRPRGTSA